LIDPTNPSIRDKATFNRVIRSGNCLFAIGTKEARDVLAQKHHAVWKEIERKNLIGEDIDDPKVVSQEEWDVVNYFGELLGREWPRAGINVPLEKMSAEQLRNHLSELETELRVVGREEQAADLAAANFRPGSPDWQYFKSVSVGKAHRAANIHQEMMRARQLLLALEGK
jgi:hypothetical protein